MPVFISHRTLDKDLAVRVYDRLSNIHNIKCWLDSVDALSNPITITQQILDGINSCTHLMAIITPNTDGSWWVPYEIGVAEQGARAIATYSQLSREVLPEYLWHWPVLQRDAQIDSFATIYKQESLLLENVKSAASKAVIERPVYRGTATSFHRRLKVLLGQEEIF